MTSFLDGVPELDDFFRGLRFGLRLDDPAAGGGSVLKRHALADTAEDDEVLLREERGGRIADARRGGDGIENGTGASVGVSDEIDRLSDGRKVEGGRPDGNGHEVRGPDGVRRSRAVVRRRIDDD